MKTSVEKRVLLGIIFLLAGTMLLLGFFNLLPWILPSFVFSWKSLLLLLGVYFLVTSKDKTTGILLMVVGSVFIAGEILDMRFWDVMKLAIPVVLIIAGLAIITHKGLFTPRQINIPEGESINDFINESNVFAGSEKKIRSQNFKGGAITSIFGGSEIDMRKANLAPGINAIDLLCIFGGTSIKVPEDWEVKIDVNAIFGGFSDDRKLENKTTTQDAEKVLYIKGMVLFGGGEIVT
jgi:predicted membrane protein